MMTNVDSLLPICKEVREKIINKKIDEVGTKISEIEEQLELDKLSIDEKFYVTSTLGKYYRKVKNYDKAGNYSRQAIRLTKNIEKNHLEMIIDTYLDYAYLEIEYGQESNARIELAKLLALLDSNQYSDPYTYGVIFSGLAKVSINEGNIESGIKQYEKTLHYYQDALPETHPIIASTINEFANLFIQVENYQGALELHQQLMKAYKAEKDTLNEARELIKIGEIYFYIDLKAARKQITNAIKLFTTLPQDSALDISKAILMLAEIDENMGNFPRAINYYKQALDQLTKVYEENHFMIVYIYSKIGTISIRTFKLLQAKDYLEKGLQLSRSYPKIRMQFLYALGKIYSDEEKYDQALEVFTEFLERLQKEGRKNSLAYGNTLQAIAFNHIKQNKIAKAFEQYQEALAIYQKLPNCKEETGLTYIRLAYCYENSARKDVAIAEEYYEKGFSMIERTRNQELLEEALAGIIDFYTRHNQAKKRRIYEEKFVKLVNKKE